MRHTIPVESLGPNGQPMAAAVESCVHCGFCLPTCPTYTTLGEEMDSPRGRIFLMKEVLEGGLELETALPYIDNCLGCQACQTACPSGVEYGELITPFRAYAEERRERPPLEWARRRLVLDTLPYPRRMRLAARAAAIARPLRRALPAALRPMVELMPASLPPAQPLPALSPARGPRRARVALLAGCAQQVLAPDIARAAVDVLTRNGVEVVVPPEQGCCGALAQHAGAADSARRHARRNLRAMPDDVDAVVSTAAGCGSGMREYGLLFAGEPDAEAAERMAGRVVDVAVLLADLGLAEAPPEVAPTTIAYQDACHLAHAQGVRRQPRELLRAIPGVELVEPAGWELCCGSAGTYNVERPDVARELGERKADNLLATGAQLVATGNIGCMTQLRTELDRRASTVGVLHTVQVLDRAYRGVPLTAAEVRRTRRRRRSRGPALP